MTTQTITVTEAVQETTAEPSPWPLAEETLAEHPEWKHIFDGWGDHTLFPPPRYLSDCELYASHDEFVDENRRAEEIDRALYNSLAQGALQRVHDSSTWVVDGTHAMPRAAVEPAGDTQPDPGADEAQHDSTATLLRWGADPAETAVIAAPVLEAPPEDEA